MLIGHRGHSNSILTTAEGFAKSSHAKCVAAVTPLLCCTAIREVPSHSPTHPAAVCWATARSTNGARTVRYSSHFAETHPNFVPNFAKFAIKFCDLTTKILFGGASSSIFAQILPKFCHMHPNFAQNFVFCHVPKFRKKIRE